VRICVWCFGRRVLCWPRWMRPGCVEGLIVLPYQHSKSTLALE
jgi:hypothetical protein